MSRQVKSLPEDKARPIRIRISKIEGLDALIEAQAESFGKLLADRRSKGKPAVVPTEFREAYLKFLNHIRSALPEVPEPTQTERFYQTVQPLTCAALFKMMQAVQPHCETDFDRRHAETITPFYKLLVKYHMAYTAVTGDTFLRIQAPLPLEDRVMVRRHVREKIERQLSEALQKEGATQQEAKECAKFMVSRAYYEGTASTFLQTPAFLKTVLNEVCSPGYSSALTHEPLRALRHSTWNGVYVKKDGSNFRISAEESTEALGRLAYMLETHTKRQPAGNAMSITRRGNTLEVHNPNAATRKLLRDVMSEKQAAERGGRL